MRICGVLALEWLILSEIFSFQKFFEENYSKYYNKFRRKNFVSNLFSGNNQKVYGFFSNNIYFFILFYFNVF